MLLVEHSLKTITRPWSPFLDCSNGVENMCSRDCPTWSPSRFVATKLWLSLMSSILSDKQHGKKKQKNIQLIWISAIRILLKAVLIALYIGWNFLWSPYQNHDAAPQFLFYFYFMGTRHFVVPSLNWLLENLQSNVCPNSRNNAGLKSRIFYVSGLCMASYFHPNSHFLCLCFSICIF